MRILNWIKPILAAAIIIALLQATGVMGSVSFYTQSALLKIGIRNASTKPLKNPEAFDYSFSLRNSAGETITFDKYKGKVAFINVWATWCGPCRAEMPTIQSLYEKMDTTGVEFVILSIDRDSDEPKIAKYVKQFNYTLPIYRPSGTLPPQIDTQYIPMTLIINKEGKIVNKEVGATNFDTPKFRKYLLSLTQ
jgi:thiol-disulfide isomerase/thioredoxin